MVGQLKANSKMKYKFVSRNYWSISGLILGILSWFLYWITPLIPIAGFIISIIGMVKSREKQSGLLIGVIGLFLSFLVVSVIFTP